MPLLALLKAKWLLFGIEAPQFIWVAAALLVLGTLSQLVRLWRLVSREKTLSRRLVTQLQALQAERGTPGREGCPEPVYDAMVQLFQTSPPLLPAWRQFDAQLLRLTNTVGEVQVWATESAHSAFQATAGLIPRVNLGFFAALPGMVTGLGLLCTFVAILVALLDVRLVDGQFQGLDNLISGLSGKFLSSIAALFAATCFLAVERALSHGLHTSPHDLASTLDGLIPRLFPTSILLTMQRDMAQQGMALQHFHTQVAAALQQGMSDGVGPILERMGTSLTQQQEVLTSACTGLVHRLEHSLDTTLSGTGRLLEGMHAQLLTTQTALGELVMVARHAATEQTVLSKTQGEHFTTVLQGFMGEMHETTGDSVHQMSAVCTAAVHDLTSRIVALGEQMASTVRDSAGQAADVAHAVITRADGWSTQSAAQLSQVLERQQGQVERSWEVQMAFDTTLGQFKEALGQYNTVTGHVSQIAAAAASITKHINATGTTIERTATLAALQAERFAETVRRQEDIQQRVAQSMQQYQQVFSQATQATQDLLTRMEQHLHRYTVLTTQGFEHVLQTADTHLGQAARHFGDTVHDLDGQLRGLADSLERLQPLGEVHGSARG